MEVVRRLLGTRLPTLPACLPPQSCAGKQWRPRPVMFFPLSESGPLRYQLSVTTACPLPALRACVLWNQPLPLSREGSLSSQGGKAEKESSFPAMSLPPPHPLFLLFSEVKLSGLLLLCCPVASSLQVLYGRYLAAFKLISPALRKLLLPGRISPELSLPPASQTPQELALPSEQGHWFPGGIFEQFLARILARTLRHLENAFSARQHKRRSQNNMKSCSDQLGETDGGAMLLAKVLFLGKPQAPGRLRGLPVLRHLLSCCYCTSALAWLPALLWLLSTCCQEDLGKAGVSDDQC